MTITRADIETILVRRCGQLLTQAGLDGTTNDGTNVDLNDPIGWALRQLGYGVTSIAHVTSSDVGQIGDDEIDHLLDVAELRALLNVQGNLTGVDFTIGPHSESLGQIGDRLDKRITALQDKIKTDYGLGLGTLTAGVVSLDFAEHGDDDE